MYKCKIPVPRSPKKGRDPGHEEIYIREDYMEVAVEEPKDIPAVMCAVTVMCP